LLASQLGVMGESDLCVLVSSCELHVLPPWIG